MVTGVVQHHYPEEKQTKDGSRTYSVHNFEINGQQFKNVFKVPQGFGNGMNVTVTSAPNPRNPKYTEHTVSLAGQSPAPQAAAPAAAYKPAGAAPAKDTYWQDKDDRISRHGCINSAINLVKHMVDANALKAAAIKTPELYTQTVFHYANLLDNAVSDASVFKDMPTFTGAINEATEVEPDAS